MDFLDNEKEFIEEDERIKAIQEMDDEEEIDATLEILEEKYPEPGMDTSGGTSEPDKTSEKKEEKDTSDDETKPTDKTDDENNKEANKDKNDTDDNDDKNKDDKIQKDEFVLTDEVINSQPEGVREMLNKYKGKQKADLAKAAASAIAMKNPWLKDNEKAIEAMAEKILTSDGDIVKTLIESQQDVGKNPPPVTKDDDLEKVPDEKIQLPQLPEEDEHVKGILNQETIKRLKKLYPNIPEDMNSVEFREWERDLADKGLSHANKYMKDLEATQSDVRTSLQKVVYAETYLKNLYEESPSELLPLLTDENLPKLKHLHDNYRSVNNKSLEGEVQAIKDELKKYELTPEDLGINLSLEKDEKGSYYVADLHPLLMNGKSVDPSVIQVIGKVPVLKKGQLVKKFLFENNPKIVSAITNKMSTRINTDAIKLKDGALKISGGSTPANTQEVDIKKITDDAVLDKTLADIESRY